MRRFHWERRVPGNGSGERGASVLETGEHEKSSMDNSARSGKYVVKEKSSKVKKGSQRLDSRDSQEHREHSVPEVTISPTCASHRVTSTWVR